MDEITQIAKVWTRFATMLAEAFAEGSDVIRWELSKDIFETVIKSIPSYYLTSVPEVDSEDGFLPISEKHEYLVGRPFCLNPKLPPNSIIGHRRSNAAPEG